MSQMPHVESGTVIIHAEHHLYHVLFNVNFHLNVMPQLAISITVIDHPLVSGQHSWLPSILYVDLKYVSILLETHLS